MGKRVIKKRAYKFKTPKRVYHVGENSTCWKGNKVGYKAFHDRVCAKFGRPKKCEVCGQDDKNKMYDWANLSGNYADVNDYKRMCRSCHHSRDKKMNNQKIPRAFYRT